MLKTKVIPIEYITKNKKEALRIKEVFDNNAMLFKIFLASYNKLSLKDSDEEATLNINSLDDLKDMTEEIIPKYMEMLHNQVYSEGGEDIETIFLKILLMDSIASNEASNIKLPSEEETGYSINTIYSIVAMDYYKEQNTPEKLLDFIYNPSPEEKTKIFEWLNKKQRYNLLNFLIEEEYQELLSLEKLENDPFLRTHLEEVLSLSEVNIFGGLIKEDKKPLRLPSLTKNELDRMCSEFFIKIDPSLKWLKLYNKLKSERKILYGQKFPDPNSKWGCLQTTDDIVIYAPLDGTLHDFVYMIHEFAHYVTLYMKNEGEYISSAIKEYPPLFFEKCALRFLQEKGYHPKAIAAIDKERALATQTNKTNISPTLRYLNQYLTIGPITFEREKEKMDKIRNAIPEELPAEMKELITALMSTDDENNVHIKIDAENAFLVERAECLYEEYPYIVGTYLATETLKRLDEDPITIFHVLNITENLANETVASVIQKIGLSDDTLTTPKTNPKQYTKTLSSANKN